jgi:hypothetical protein
MKRPVLFVAVVAASAMSAWGQAPAEQALLGVWKCETEANGMNVKSSINYAAGGKETFDMVVKGDAGGMSIEFNGAGTADWKFLPDGKMEDTVTGITIAGGKLNGQDVPAPTLQSMIEGMLLNQVSTSTVTIKDKAMTMVDQDNVTSACTR